MKQSKQGTGGHVWRFFRAGGFDQVRLDSGYDLLSLEQLDQKLWVALACPVDNVHFDTRTLLFIDTDGDRRIRARELIAAIKWIVSLLKKPDDLIDSANGFFLSSINDSTPEGNVLLTAAKNAIGALEKRETDALSVDDINSLEKILSQKPFNGDGIITVEADTSESIRILITEITQALGAENDRSGNPGISAEKVEAYFNQAQDYEAWFTESERDPAVLCLGADTEIAAKSMSAVRDKIDDYFARCAIALFDERAQAALNGDELEFGNITKGQLSMNCNEIAALPLSHIGPQRQLPLLKGVNPAWFDAIQSFECTVVSPMLGSKETLSENDWRNITSAFSPWFAWQGRKPSGMFDATPIVRVRELLNGDTRQTLMALISQDLAQSAAFESLTSLEKLVRFHRDLYSLCTNFVNFKDFYARGGTAIFIAGTLYLDQRSCSLCIKVDDVNKHSIMAAMAGTYLIYCECKRKAGAEKINIVAAFTNGDSENLIVGRNGIFYDRAGSDWDATIIRIIENPISLRQAFWLPYKSLVRMIESQVAKRATAANAQSTAKLEQTAVSATNVDKNVPTPPKKLDVGVVAALGVAAGALGTFIATLLGYASGIVSLGPLAIIGAMIGVVLLISGPSLILAYIKLRKRNIGPILDANGWAVNAKAKINVPFGTELTRVASLPPGAQRDLLDPYAEKRSPWPKIVIFALVMYLAYFTLNHLGFINEWTGGRVGLKIGQNVNTVTIEKKTTVDVPGVLQ